MAGAISTFPWWWLLCGRRASILLLLRAHGRTCQANGDSSMHLLRAMLIRSRCWKKRVRRSLVARPGYAEWSSRISLFCCTVYLCPSSFGAKWPASSSRAALNPPFSAMIPAATQLLARSSARNLPKFEGGRSGASLPSSSFLRVSTACYSSDRILELINHPRQPPRHHERRADQRRHRRR